MYQLPDRVRQRNRFSLAFLLSLLPALLATPVVSSAQGLTYTVSPSARWVEWDEDLGFKQSRLYGGSLGIGFGRYVGLQAFHHQGDGLRLLESVEGEEAPKLFDLSKPGMQVSLSLGTGTFVPLVVGGGSLLTFQPKGGDELKRLSLDYGAGFRVVLAESLHGEVLVESTQFRLDPVFLATGVPGFEGSGPLRRNMTLRASLGLQLGRRSFDRGSELDDAFAERYQAPFSNFALAIEPLIGRLDYDKAVDLKNQEMVGIRAGFDFGSFFGLRGFHWWGTDSDFRSTTDLKAYGGEAQFTLASGPGINPYLVGGVGELSWGKAKDDEPARPKDQTALILGGGVDFNFGNHIRATVAARDFILSGSDLAASPNLNTISDPDQLVHNWQFSAGLKFLVGRSGIRSGKEVAPKVIEAQPAVMPEPEAAVQADAPAVRADAPTPATVPGQPTVVVVPQPTPVLPTAQAQPPAQGVTATMPITVPDTIANWIVPGQVIVLPVLEHGEIYIRFGEPGSVPLVTSLGQGEVAPPETAPTTQQPAPAAPQGAGQSAPTLEEIRRLIQEELGRQPNRPATDSEALRELESRLLQRLDEIERTARRAEAATPREPVVIRERPARRDTIVVTEVSEASGSMSRRVEELRPYTGMNVTNDAQLLLGMAADIGPITPGSKFRLIPQIALGVGEGPTSLLVGTDVEYRLPEVQAGSRITFEPLVGIGAGLINRNKMELQLGMFLGSGVRFYKRNGAMRLHLFGGLQGIDFFEDTRIIVGMRRFR